MLALLMQLPGAGAISAVSSDLLVGYLFEVIGPMITTFESPVLLYDSNSISGGVFVLENFYCVSSRHYLGVIVKCYILVDKIRSS